MNVECLMMEDGSLKGHFLHNFELFHAGYFDALNNSAQEKVAL
ncbi:hypothetical protein [Epilithonimonas vandammei]|nr:hypothetical protein [Epilithonimonas vandammei]